MSKITQKNKELKNKQPKSDSTPEPKSSILNYGKCCTCRYRLDSLCTGNKSPKKDTHVPRKMDACDSYKCKIG